MAPEQVRGEPALYARADVFAVGCVLFECLTGRPAFGGSSAAAILAKILLEEPPRISALRDDVPDALDTLVARAMSKSALDRPADARALDKALRAIDAVADHASSSVETAPETLAPRERHRVYVVMSSAPAESTGTIDELRRRLCADAAPSRAHLEVLADGSVAAALTEGGSATDRAAAAARLALALRSALPGAAVAVATASGILAGQVPVGEVIDHAAALLGAPATIRIDEATAGLLDARFDVGGDDDGLALEGECDPAQEARALLGRPGPRVGRDREIECLEALFNACADEELARAVVLSGPPDAGKSRVLVELLARIDRRGRPVEVWIAGGDPRGAAPPFGMLAQLIRRAAGIRDGEPAAVRRQKIRGRVRRNVSEKHAARIAEVLGGLVSDEGSALDSGSEQVRRAFVDFLAVECDARPVIVVLEDLHRGDPATVEAIDAALRELHERRLFVAALGRPEISARFPALWAGRAVTAIELTG
jgi:hypothetical protein